MSVGPVSSSPSIQSSPAPHAPPPKPASGEMPVDKVTISPAAMKAAGGGDADHDGDAK